MAYRNRYVADRRSLGAVVIVLVGLGQFFFNLYRAIYRFDSFSASQNFLSDLGRTTEQSATYFNFRIITLGLCLGVFFAMTAMQSGLGRFGIAGLVSAVGLIGIGLTPLDEFYVAHHVCLLAWLLPMFTMIVSSIRIFSGPSHRAMLILGSILLCAIALYIGSAGSTSAPAYQKLVVVLAIVWLWMICFHTTFAVIEEFVCRTSIGNDARTKAYMERLESDGMYSAAGRGSGNQFKKQATRKPDSRL